MKLRFQDSLFFADIQQPFNLNEHDRQIINDYVKERDAVCNGCKKKLGSDWFGVLRKKNSTLVLFCGKSCSDCIELWRLKYLEKGGLNEK